MMPDFDQSAFEKLRDKVLTDIAGAMGAFMAFIGDQTGVYKTLQRRGRCRPEELATLAGVDRRYLLEWLSSNAANGYVDYPPRTEPSVCRRSRRRSSPSMARPRACKGSSKR